MRRLDAILVGLVLAGAMACGGGSEAPAPSGRSMDGGTPVARAPAERPDVEGSRSGPRAGEPPVVESVQLSPREPSANIPVTAVVDAFDPDGDLVQLAFTWALNGEVVQEGGSSSITLPDLEKGDELVVTVVASDGPNRSAARSARARVANRVPVVDDVLFQPANTVRAGDELAASPMARDPDGDELRFRYEWKVNGAVRGNERSFPTQGLRRGDRVSVRVTASDGSSESGAFTSREIVLGNTPPRIARLPEVETDSGTFKYQFEAIDADGDRNLRFFLERAPDGMSVDAITGLLTWKPEPGQAGVHPVEIGVLDGAGEGTTFVFEVTVKADQAPADADGQAPANVED